jgi:NADH dehydrogenase
MKLENGSRVGIVGGGPAGVFFALNLRLFAEQYGVLPKITIYQQRDFNAVGPKGCKGCAGILSTSLLANMEELGLTLPREVVRNRLTAYNIHSPYTSITINNPEKDGNIISIYRGSGPRLPHDNTIAGFDGWLLSQAKQSGIEIVETAVAGIKLGNLPRIQTQDEESECDLAVLAAGVCARPVSITGLNYTPPGTQIMAVDELYAGIDQVESKLGNTAHGFLIPRLGVVFGGLVPKGPFITVTLLSSGNPPVKIEDFLQYNIVREVLPDSYERACGCRPRAVTGSARNYYSDRFVAIGDAAVSKLYQDGMNSAFLTARRAAHTAIFHGVSRQDFSRHYTPVFNDIKRDNLWGHTLFSMNHRAKNSRTFLLAQHRLTGIEQDDTRKPQPFTRAAWGMLTGSYDYGDLMRGMLRPFSTARLLGQLILESFRGIFSKGTTSPRKLHVGGRKVLILGSGFAGINTLRHLVRKLNRNENVETTIVSNENYTLFTPLLHEVALGRIGARHIAYPVRSLHWRDRFSFIQANIEKIDLDSRQVVTADRTLDYDYLVLALGSNTDMSAIGMEGRNVFTLKSLNDARVIRNHIISIFEQANAESDPERQKRLLTFVVSGAGYTGVQVVTGLRDLVRSSLPKFYKSIDTVNIRVILIETGPKIVGELHTKIGAYIMKYMKDKGIEVKLLSRITHAGEESIEINNSENLSTSTVIWVPGVTVNPLVTELDADKDDTGRLLVNEYLEVPGAPGVYAAGDCVHFKNPRSGRPIPPLARTAASQARIVARNILADIRGTGRKSYCYFKPWDFVNLGTYKAVFRFRFIRLYGVFPRFLLTTAYLFLISGTPNRIRIVIDWTLSLFFGRDTTYLRQSRES